MTILRSREIIPKQQHQTLKSQNLLQPTTPSKTHESPSPKPSSSSATTTTTTSSPKPSSCSARRRRTTTGGGVRRRSVRLASKSTHIETIADGSTITASKEDGLKKNVDEEGCSSGSDSGNKGKRKSRVSGSRKKKKSRVGELESEEAIMGLGEDGDEEEEENAGDLGKLGAGSLVGRSEGGLVNAVDGEENGEVGIDLNSLPLGSAVEEVTIKSEVLSLRSGTRIAKRRIEVIDVDAEVIDLDSDGNDKERKEGGIGASEGEWSDDPGLSLNLGLESEFDRDVEVLGKDSKWAFGGSTSTNIKNKLKYTKEEKGKGAMIKDDDSPVTEYKGSLELSLLPAEGDLIREAASELEKELEKRNLEKSQVRSTQNYEHFKKTREELAIESARRRKVRRQGDRERRQHIARQNASRFAHFQRQEEGDNMLPPVPNNGAQQAQQVDQEVEDWPGPFSTAMKIINNRNKRMKDPYSYSTAGAGITIPEPHIEWTPSVGVGRRHSRPAVPSLLNLCLKSLAKISEGIPSLVGVPDSLRHKLSQLMCDFRKMDHNFFELLASGSPTEIRVKDCSWMTEELLTKFLGESDTKQLTVLQLDQCGRCLPDYILRSTLARTPNSLPALVSISLKGACRLTDAGLKTLVVSAPALRSINLSHCSLLTSCGIDTLVDSLGSVLMELYLDECPDIDTQLILPALKRLKCLEVLSVAGIQTVCDDFVIEFVTDCGQNMKELSFAGCRKLTDASVKAIAENCSQLCALDLSLLLKLTNSSLGFLASGCRLIQKLRFHYNLFSDEAVAAFLEVSGDSLTELSLNNVKKVGSNTAISLARRCSRNLRRLDLSFCRNLTDAGAGLIVDNCLSLEVLKLFGCTQITEVFLEGHSNSLVQISGLKKTRMLEHVHIHVLGLQEGPLRYSSVPPCT